jgi:hypothetical protein
MNNASVATIAVVATLGVVAAGAALRWMFGNSTPLTVSQCRDMLSFRGIKKYEDYLGITNPSSDVRQCMKMVYGIRGGGKTRRARKSTFMSRRKEV